MLVRQGKEQRHTPVSASNRNVHRVPLSTAAVKFLFPYSTHLTLVYFLSGPVPDGA